MKQPIDFYFDFSSPYGYFASLRIDEIARRHERNVIWRPYLLGAVFKITRMQPLLDYPIKGEYMKRDWQRTARLQNARWTMPEMFPFAAINASRVVYWLGDKDPALAQRFAKAAYHQAFGEGRDIVSVNAVAAIAESIGVPQGDTLAALNDPAVKERLRKEVDAGIERGVFGSPFIIVDGEPFWGADRLDQVDGWLATGGW